MRIIAIINSKLILLAFLLVVGTNLFAQKITITGSISDVDGPMQGVNIAEVSSTSRAITDGNGKFSIQAASNGSILISYIGYESQTVKINGKTTIKVVMKENLQNLDEVVVVGYGTMKKRDITGSISSISAKEMEKSRPVNLADALQGKIAGLDIMTSSEPGANSSYRIRGTSTLSDGGSNPLFIVDGMEVQNINDINPRDIASVEVLKDAASTAIYGSKSANGVILITTKEGNSSKAKVSLSYSLKQSEMSKMMPQMNRLQGFRYEQLRNFLSGNYFVANRDSLNPSFTADNFYQSLLFRKAYTNQVDASVSGSDKRIKYFISAGYVNEQGIQINTYNNRMTTRINVDYKGNDKLTIGSRVALTVSNQRQASWGSRAQMLQRAANFSVYEPDGSYTPVLYSRPNPVAVSMLGPDNYKNYNLNLNEFLEYKFIPALSFKASISGTSYQSNRNSFLPAILDQALRAKSTNSNRTDISWTQENVLNFWKKFKDAHEVWAMGGFSLQENTSDNTQLNVTDNITSSIPISSAYGAVVMSQTYATWTGNRMASFFGRGSYSYKSRYLFNTNIRYDGSSRFGTNTRWGLFPSASAGWRISDESFMKWSKKILKDAKFRVSYGVTGNQWTGDFATQGLYGASTYANDMGLSPSQLSNPNLGWEQTKQFNTGLDLIFFDGRLKLTADYYKKMTSNVLYQVSIPQTSGFKNLYKNIGSVNNNGFELAINSTNIRTKDFQWNSSLNFSFNKNVIASIPDGGQQFINNVFIVDKGYAVGTMYGWKRKAIFSYDQSNAFTPDWTQLTPIFDQKDRFKGYQLNGEAYTGEIKQLRNGSSIGAIYKAGDVKWDDINHDGVIDAKDRQVLGCGQPTVTGGLWTEFKYKNFSLSAYIYFALGGKVFNETEFQNSNQYYSAWSRPNPVILANSWMAPGDVALYPSPANTATLDNTREASDLWIQDGSYIRLKNIRLGYSLPKTLIKTLGIESMDVFALMQNFFTWSNYSGFDPEFPSWGLAVGYDYNSYPKSKDILIGINLNF